MGSYEKGEDYIHDEFFDGYHYGDGKIKGDTNQNGRWDKGEKWQETSPNDMDSDDDGVRDYNESIGDNKWWMDHDEDGMINAVDPDSDNDGLYDGLERGYRPGMETKDTDLSRGYFIPDTDHCTTDPYNEDTDNDTIKDGIEDRNRNGRIDGDNGDGIYSNNEVWTETNPNSWDTDGDSIRDNKEIEYGYNPLSKDSDNDGLNDTEEDKNRNGILDPGETDPTLMDTDGDGLTDLMEISGWMVVIRYEATGEEKVRYQVYSNPRLVDTDSDLVNDLDEYKNASDPTKADSDGDGKTDYEELNGDFNSSATGIDGEPPTIWMFDCQYRISFDRYLGIKIPSGLKVSIDIGVKDIFGLNYVAIYISGLPDVIKYCNNSVNISDTFEWELTGIDQYARAFVKGFKINLTAMDRNGNIGFKNDELKSIAEIVVSAYIGALLSVVKFIAELASGIFEWIISAITNIINSIMTYINNIIKDFGNKLMNNIKINTSDNSEGSKFEISEETASNAKDFADLCLNIVGWIGSALMIVSLIFIIVEALTSLVPVKLILSIIVGVCVSLIISFIIGLAMKGILGDNFDINLENGVISIFNLINNYIEIPSLILQCAAFILAIIAELLLLFKGGIGIKSISGSKPLKLVLKFLPDWTFTIMGLICTILSVIFSKSIIAKLLFWGLGLIFIVIGMLKKAKIIRTPDSLTEKTKEMGQIVKMITEGIFLFGTLTGGLSLLAQLLIWFTPTNKELDNIPIIGGFKRAIT